MYTAAFSGELFGRIETPQNVFVKGNIGVGSLSGGHMNDEDWAIFGGTVAYSNTLSDPVNGNIDYATLDLGYDFFRGLGYKLGAFVGYNYYKENKSAYGCTQIANPLSDCVPAIPSSVLGITENDTWKSLRIGVNGDIMITDQLKLGADIAYLPYVKFNGTDDHLQRAPTFHITRIGHRNRVATRKHSLLPDHRPALRRRRRALLGHVDDEGCNYRIRRCALSLSDATRQD